MVLFLFPSQIYNNNYRPMSTDTFFIILLDDISLSPSHCITIGRRHFNSVFSYLAYLYTLDHPVLFFNIFFLSFYFELSFASINNQCIEFRYVRNSFNQDFFVNIIIFHVIAFAVKLQPLKIRCNNIIIYYHSIILIFF